jgi:hypothetical protein
VAVAADRVAPEFSDKASPVAQVAAEAVRGLSGVQVFLIKEMMEGRVLATLATAAEVVLVRLVVLVLLL